MPEISDKPFTETQYAFAAHLRDPENNAAPGSIEDRRMNIYRELIYNNIESFISSGFPILRSILDDDSWHRMVRTFVAQHQSETPYFLEISQEFLQFLQEEYTAASAPAFLLELAHYEWVELALDVSAEEFPFEHREELDLLEQKPQVSPLAWRLSYQFPVHKLGPQYLSEHQPDEVPQQGTFLVVYRNRDHQVKFLETNAVTIRLLQLLEEGGCTGRQALLKVAEELNFPADSIVKNGAEILEQLYQLQIII